MDTGADTLGGVLRAWRDRRHPLDVGLVDGGDRRAPGLRREELAALAGLSVDYVVRLEQGRATTPSAQVVSALARALQLADAERDLLYRLAGLLPPVREAIAPQPPPGLQRLLSRLGDIPLGVFCADWTLVSWTPLWAALHGEPPRRVEDRNLLRQRFLRETDGWTDGAGWSGAGGDADPDPGADDGDRTGRRVIHAPGGDAEFDAALVGDLRRAASEHPGNRELATLVAELRQGSERFERLWASGAVGIHAESQKVVVHPQVGEILVDCDTLMVPGTDHRVVAYTVEAGTPAAERLDFLRVTAARAVFAG